MRIVKCVCVLGPGAASRGHFISETSLPHANWSGSCSAAPVKRSQRAANRFNPQRCLIVPVGRDRALRLSHPCTLRTSAHKQPFWVIATCCRLPDPDRRRLAVATSTEKTNSFANADAVRGTNMMRRTSACAAAQLAPATRKMTISGLAMLPFLAAARAAPTAAADATPAHSVMVEAESPSDASLERKLAMLVQKLEEEKWSEAAPIASARDAGCDECRAVCQSRGCGARTGARREAHTALDPVNDRYREGLRSASHVLGTVRARGRGRSHTIDLVSNVRRCWHERTESRANDVVDP
jgi:hypothetical protein